MEATTRRARQRLVIDVEYALDAGRVNGVDQ
jgi:hypothetical protein